ncbi:MAG: META domain-containing protein [Betaproteobacteria bacterium]|nr:META domain-containing protein [Betaproteobacteria bacterium]
MFAHRLRAHCKFGRVLSAAALSVLGACAAPPPSPEELPPTTADAPRPAQPIADGRWELVGSSFIAGRRLPGARRPTLEFKDGRLAAYSGCNRATGNAVEADGRMAVGRLATTRMACPEPLASFEQRFFSLIEAEPELRLEGEELVLVAGSENARFQRAEAAPGARRP